MMGTLSALASVIASLIAPLIASLGRGWKAVPPVARGLLLVLTGTLLGASMNGMTRALSADLHAFEIAFFRCLFGFLMLSPSMMRQGSGPLRTRRFPLHALRGVLQSFSMTLNTLAVTISPLAKVTALQFSSPLFATLLAALFLRERVRARRISAMVLGFCGTLIIVRPGFAALDPGAMAALVAAAAFAVVMIVMKTLSSTESSVTQTLYMTIFTTPATFVAAMFVWVTPELHHMPWLIALGALGILGNIAFVQALHEADLTAVLPMLFTKLVWAAAIGFVFFGEVPGIWTWVGGSVIFASATYIGFRERKLTGQAQELPAGGTVVQSKPPRHRDTEI